MSASNKYAAYIGIDWADQKHDIWQWDAETQQKEHRVLPHTPEALNEWIQQLQQRHPGQKIAICLEQSRGPLVYALMCHANLVLFPVNPVTLARYRSAFTPSQAKDDPSDAEFLCELVRMHEDRLSPWRPEDEKTRQLRLLCEHRRDALGLRGRMSNRMVALLKSYYPQARELAGDEIGSPIACDFLLKWTTLEQVQKAKPHAIRAFFYAHNCRSEQVIARRLEIIQKGQPLTTDPAVIEPMALDVRMLARLIKDLDCSIREYDQRIKRLFDTHEDAFIFDSFPGAGAALAPRLLCAFGTDRQRYAHAHEIQTFGGIAPVVERSGKQMWVHWRWHRPVFLCQTFYEFAQRSMVHCPWAMAYYRMQLSRGKRSHAAIRALAYKWIRILFRCWQERIPYDDRLYMDELVKRGAELLQYLNKPEGKEPMEELA